jgi:hemerythrin-like domain-containing protein
MPASRIRRIVRLSAEHRLALELVATIREEIQLGSCSDALLLTVANEFASKLEKHFKLEETSLLTAFAEHLDQGLVMRTRDEHEKLRALVVDIHRGSVVALRVFAELLEAHIHFEEQELYPVIRACLEPVD